MRPLTILAIGMILLVIARAGLTEEISKKVSQTNKEIIGKDGASMVLVPAGEFTMGSTREEVSRAVEECKATSKLDDSHCREWFQNEAPSHRIVLDVYYIDKYEVTTSFYSKFMRDSKRPEPPNWDMVNLGVHSNRPVIGIDWSDADAYCRWTGKRLPTEAEWEKAARGTDGRTYPWGNKKPTHDFANYWKEKSVNNVYGDVITPVGYYESGKSPYGIYDMAGNVWEWVADWYEPSYYQHSEMQNPKGPSRTEKKVLRGGSWNASPILLRATDRKSGPPSLRNHFIGFRCAMDAPK